MTIPGDIVRHEGEEKVVVDVAGEDVRMAILRNRDDLTGEKLVAAPADDLEVVGHLAEPS